MIYTIKLNTNPSLKFTFPILETKFRKPRKQNKSFNSQNTNFPNVPKGIKLQTQPSPKTFRTFQMECKIIVEHVHRYNLLDGTIRLVHASTNEDVDLPYISIL